ncbi:MAG: hypothetical protein JSS37_02535 [Proteobacteria bacterium]|nr:hypothetical protein [Pseudomonadota bacterium]
MPWVESIFASKGLMVKAVIIIMITWFLYFIFYIPSREMELMKKAENRFNDTNADMVMVKDSTDFNWDTVCYIAPYSTKSLNFIEKDYRSVLDAHLPHVGWPSNYGAYFFIKNNIVIEKYIFENLGFRYTKNNVYPLALVILVNDRPFLFMGEHNSENDSCISSKDAAFKKVFRPEWNEGRILITNIKKENR